MAGGPLRATWYILVFGQALGGMPSFPQGTLSEPKCDLSPFWLKGLIISHFSLFSVLRNALATLAGHGIQRYKQSQGELEQQ